VNCSGGGLFVVVAVVGSGDLDSMHEVRSPPKQSWMIRTDVLQGIDDNAVPLGQSILLSQFPFAVMGHATTW
jgi:hypothetical protein